jgi:uncharacterized protein YyaL (SSP411 family)
MAQHPTAFAHALAALERVVTPPLEIVVVGERDDPGRRALVREVTGRFLPATVRIAATPAETAGAGPLLAGRTPVGARAAAYVCRAYACERPVTDPGELRALIDAAWRERAQPAAT